MSIELKEYEGFKPKTKSNVKKETTVNKDKDKPKNTK